MLESPLQQHSHLSPVGDAPFALCVTQVSGRNFAAGDPPKQWCQGSDPSEFLLCVEEPLERLGLQGGMGLDLQDVSGRLRAQRAHEEGRKPPEQFAVVVQCAEQF